MRAPAAIMAVLAGVLALAPLPAQAQQGQSCGVGRPCPGGFSCSNLAGNSLTGWGRCNRDRPRALGEACGPGAQCAAGLSCEAFTQVCRGPGGEGDACHATRPCGSGLSCEAGTQTCRGPGREGESCHLTRPCGSGLSCEAGTQTCRAPGREGEACHATRPCGQGLNCEAGSQVCRRPGIVGETCHATRPCGNGLSCQAIGAQGLFKCAQDELDLNSARPCGQLYVQAVSDLARRAGTAFTWGAGGSGTAGIASGNLETGVAYGPNGEFGCYATVCAGVATPGFTVASYAGAAIYNTWNDVAGLAFNLNQSVTASRALTAVVDIGPGFNISQWLNGNWQLIGTTVGFSMNLGFSVVPIVSLGAAACCTVVAERGASISSLRTGVQNCATTAQSMVANIASRRPISQAAPVVSAGPPPVQPPVVAGGPTGRMIVGELPVGQVLNGNLPANAPQVGGRPMVWYTFRCSPGFGFQVDVTSNWDNVVAVVDPSGQQVAFNDDSDGTNARVRHACQSGAPHLIGVGAYSAANVGSYMVQLNSLGGQPQPDPQPQPVPQPQPAATAPGVHMGELQIGATITGNLPGNMPQFEGRPAVWYSFRCTPGLTFQVDVTSPWDNVAFLVENGQRVAYNDDANGTNARLGYSCRSGTMVFIGVGAYSAANIGQYTLQLSATGGVPQPLPQPQPQPIPQPSPAGPQVVGTVSVGATVAGQVTPSSPPYGGRPAVFYRFQCQAGQAVTVTVASSWDNVAFIADGALNQLAFSDDADGTNARIEWKCPGTAGYLVGVGAFSSAGTGVFTLRVLGGGAGRSFEMRRQPKPDGGAAVTRGKMCRASGVTSRFAARGASCANGVCATGAPRDTSSLLWLMIGAMLRVV